MLFRDSMKIRLNFAALLVLLLGLPLTGFAGPKAEVIYKLAQQKLNTLKAEWLTKYNKATNRKQKKIVLNQLSKILPEKIANSMLIPWYGTQWAFHGTTTKPGQGTIACGYFVTTVLRDSGVRINRVRMAQVASETMIRNINVDKNIKRYRNKTIQHFVAEVEKWGPGLYVVGLDYHTGFILNKNNKVTFIHSSFYPPTRVLSEKAVSSQALQESNYRVLGKLFANEKSIKKWLLN